MKDETGGVAIEEFNGLKPKLYSFFVDNTEYKNRKGVNRNVVATINHNEYKDLLLNSKCIRHLIGTQKINKVSLSCFDGKIYIQHNGYYRLALRY